MRNTKEARPHALIADPFFGNLGGAKIVTVWMLQALRDEFDLTLLSWYPLDLNRLNRFAGTDLRASDFHSLTPNRFVRMLGDTINKFDRDAFSAQRWCLLMRMLKKVGPHYDVVISSNDETDFGARGIQYIHYPYLGIHSEILTKRSGRKVRVKAGQRFRPWRLISGFDFEQMSNNKTLVNSDWTGRAVYENYGIGAETLYPPVPGRFAQYSWNERDDVVVCVGRLSDDKRLDWIIEAVRQVREDIPSFGLRIVGIPDAHSGGAKTFERLQKFAAEHDWVELHIDVPREVLCSLMSRSKIGLHAKEDEHFGIGVAEMVLAGCIVLTHNSGGQVEIVDADPQLLFHSPNEAAQKIRDIVTNRSLREEIAKRLLKRRGKYSSDHFSESFRSIVRTFLQEPRVPVND